MTTSAASRYIMTTSAASRYWDKTEIPECPLPGSYEVESVAKLGQWVIDHQKWAIIESARAVS
jgi:hypothetical protein